MKTPSLLQKRFLRRGGNRGVAVIYIALMLVALFAFVALAIDIGYMYVAKTQLQNAADSAALAGASRLNGTTVFTNQTGARLEAQRFALANKAANDNVYVDTNINNIHKADDDSGYDGDIVLGYWDGTKCNPNQSSGKRADCVKVTARRTNELRAGISSQNKPVSTFFGKAIKVSKINISATATAKKSPLQILPIVVNEYWMALSPGVPPPYGSDQNYPNSFVRLNNVDMPPSASKVFGKTFAIIGSNASDNVPQSWAPGAQNIDGYVNLDYRTSSHDGSGNSWYTLTTAPLTPLACATCLTGPTALFTGPTAVVTGQVVNAKYDSSLMYLLDGFPDNYPYPIPIQERFASSYPSTTYDIPTSQCPFSSVPYFTGGGGSPLSKSYNGKRFPDVYPPGSRLIAMVYDGSFKPETDPSAANAVTIVGYSPIEIDGYSNALPTLSTTGPTRNIGTDGNTAYGHALGDILATSSTFGFCNTSFFDRLTGLAFQFGRAKLVK